MAELSNLALDIQEESRSKPGDSLTSLVARVYLGVACSYLKDVGAPTITQDCRTLSEFELEIPRIKNECDEILAQTRLRFAEVDSSDETGAKGTAQRESPLQPADPGGAAAKGEKPTVTTGKHLTVSDAMTRDTKTMRRSDKLSIADDLMKVGKFRHVVALDDDADDVVGIISHRDIFYGALGSSTGLGETAHQESLDTIPAKDVLNSDVIATSPETSLADACQVMIEKKVGCLPVLNDRGLVGILTEGDLLAILSRAEYGAV